MGRITAVLFDLDPTLHERYAALVSVDQSQLDPLR